MYLLLFLSHITSRNQWDKEERPPERTFFLRIWSVHWKSFFLESSNMCDYLDLFLSHIVVKAVACMLYYSLLKQQEYFF